MSGTGWFFTIGIIYLVLLFTLAVLSFRKGHRVLGLIGFISRCCGLSAPSCRTGAAAADGMPPVINGTSS